MNARLPTLLLALAVAGCSPHYDWVEPETPSQPQASSSAAADKPSTSPDLAGPQTAEDLACEGSTSATRAQARRNRYRSIEGFNTRGCMRTGPWKGSE